MREQSYVKIVEMAGGRKLIRISDTSNAKRFIEVTHEEVESLCRDLMQARIDVLSDTIQQHESRKDQPK